MLVSRQYIDINFKIYMPMLKIICFNLVVIFNVKILTLLRMTHSGNN